MVQLNDPVRVALVGGGVGSMIGPAHVAGATASGARLVAGCFSRDPQRNRASAAQYGLAPERAYDSMESLLATAATLPPNERPEVVVVTTPNSAHYAAARAALEAGLHVVCEKPLTARLEQAEELVRVHAAARTSAGKPPVFAVTHTYTGHPGIRRARRLVREGALGTVQAARATYLQGWLRAPIEESNEQARWRTDPLVAGPTGTFGDIGSHAFNLLCYVTGLRPARLSAQLATLAPGRALDDYGQALLQGAGGELGVIVASQVSHGYDNELRLEVDGTDGALAWSLAEPERVVLRRNGAPPRVEEEPAPAVELPAGADDAWRHLVPDSTLRAFATLYADVFADVRAGGAPVPGPGETPYPNLADGHLVMAFLDRALASTRVDGAWMPFEGATIAMAPL